MLWEPSYETFINNFSLKQFSSDEKIFSYKQRSANSSRHSKNELANVRHLNISGKMSF